MMSLTLSPLLHVIMLICLSPELCRAFAMNSFAFSVLQVVNSLVYLASVLYLMVVLNPQYLCGSIYNLHVRALIVHVEQCF